MKLTQALGLGVVLSGVATPPARAGTCASDGQPVQVMTLNTWGLPAPISQDRRGRMPRIQDLVRQSEADLVGLQEVWRGALSLLDLDLIRPGFPDGDTGLALVTRHPMRAQREIRFQDAAGVDRFKAKGALASEVVLPELGPTWVVVTHLQAGAGERPAGVRARQVDQLLALPDAGQPALLMGDFNLHRNDPVDQATAARLAQAGWIDTADAAGDPKPTFPGSGERFDRILFRDGPRDCLLAQRVDVGGEGLSDHLSVRADLLVGLRAGD